MFHAVALMSAPFGGTPEWPFDTAGGSVPVEPPDGPDIYEEMARLPRPRKHYQRYYRTREANENMWRAPQGVHDFLRAYYHHKSADWARNRPYRLAGWTAEEVAKMPTYYIMDLDMGMAETVAREMPTAAEIAANRWLPDRELRVYSEEYGRNGFQGGLQWYRSGVIADETLTFAGRTIDIPSLFIAGSSDWGAYQRPGSLERMQERAVHGHARRPLRRRGGALGAAGAAGGDGTTAAGFPACGAGVCGVARRGLLQAWPGHERSRPARMVGQTEGVGRAARATAGRGLRRWETVGERKRGRAESKPGRTERELVAGGGFEPPTFGL